MEDLEPQAKNNFQSHYNLQLNFQDASTVIFNHCMTQTWAKNMKNSTRNPFQTIPQHAKTDNTLTTQLQSTKNEPLPFSTLDSGRDSTAPQELSWHKNLLVLVDHTTRLFRLGSREGQVKSYAAISRQTCLGITTVAAFAAFAGGGTTRGFGRGFA